MKFNRSVFYLFCFASVFSLCAFDANAKCPSAADSGHFCKGLISTNKCREGCYCVGGTKTGVGGHNVERACSERWQDSGVWSDLNAGGVFLCPEGYTESDAKAKSKTDCYNKETKKHWKSPVTVTLVSVKTPCNPGYYLPANSNGACRACADVYTVSSGKACLGGAWETSSVDQGITTCPSGQEPNSTLTACVAKKVTCAPGKYLPKNSENCAACPRYAYCEGGYYAVSSTEDQGLDYFCGETIYVPKSDGSGCEIDTTQTVTCPSGQYLPKNTNECATCPSGKTCLGGEFHLSGSEDQGLQGAVAVKPGYYLPAGATKQKSCTGSSRYCPGGTFSVSNKDQGIYACPTGARATSDKTACSLTLTKDQMMYGISGKEDSSFGMQCWLKTGEDYKTCIGIGTYNTINARKITDDRMNVLHEAQYQQIAPQQQISDK